MIHDFKQISILKLKKPKDQDVNQELQWLSMSLGLFGERDKEKSCFRIFVELVKAGRRGLPLTSDHLAARTNITRATVIYHMRRLMEAGIVIADGNRYRLRADSLEEMIQTIKKETAVVLEDIQKMAELLDEELGLVKKNRKVHVISD